MHRNLLPLAALLACAPAEAGVTVTLRDRADVTTSVVTVADVAEVTPDGPADAVAAARLGGVPLAPAPAAGRTAALTAAAVRTRAEAGGFRVRLAGASSVTLRPARRPRPAAPLPLAPAAADRAWAEAFAAAAVARSLDRGGAPPANTEVALHDDAVRVLAADRPDACDVAGLSATPGVAQTVRLRWLDDADRVRSVPAAVRLSAPRLVPVLTAAAARGTPVTAAAVAWEPAAETNPAAKPTAAANAAVGTRPATFRPAGEAARDLPAGARLSARDVRPAPLVRANQTVVVESRAGGVRVTRALKANRTGALGETVPLTVPGTRERVFARVVGNRRAVIVGDEFATRPYAATGGD